MSLVTSCICPTNIPKIFEDLMRIFVFTAVFFREKYLCFTENRHFKCKNIKLLEANLSENQQIVSSSISIC